MRDLPAVIEGIDLCGGPGGWDLAALNLGWHVLGIEIDDAACATRRAAGLHTLQANIATLVPSEVEAMLPCGKCGILIASPPCTTFSMAGKGIGRLILPDLVRALHEIAVDAPGTSIEPIRERVIARILALTAKAKACTDCDENGMVERVATPEEVDAGCELGVAFDPCPNGCSEDGDDEAADTGNAEKDAYTTTLVLEPLRWVRDLRPDMVAMEQVPPVLPLWEAVARILRDDLGYRSSWTGKVNAADFGVPQTRQRAVLIAHRTQVIQPPQPTHCRGGGEPTLFGPGLEPWVSMAAALGWGMTAKPSVTLTAGSGRGGGPDPLDGGAGAREALRTERREGRWVPPDSTVGFPRRDDKGSDGYRERDLRSIDEPAFAVTEKARSWELHPGEQIVVNTGRDWKPGGSRADAQQFDPAEQPAPSITGTSGPGMWQVEIRNRWQLRNGNQENAAVRDEDEPAPTIAFGHNATGIVWEPAPDDPYRECPVYLEHGACVCSTGYPSNCVMRDTEDLVVRTGTNTMKHGGGKRSINSSEIREALEHGTMPDGRPRINDQSGEHHDPSWVEERPATTVASRDLVGHPGATSNRFNDSEKSRNDGIRITVQEAAVLQSFPPDYPWQGSRTKQFEQVGNAYPPLLAWHTLRAVAVHELAAAR